MSRPGGAAQVLADARDFSKCQLGKRIHLLDGRHKDQIHSMALADFEILGQWPRILRVILIGTELQRIHKNADHDCAGFLPRSLNQRLMPGMERTHRGHQPDQVVRFSHGFERFSR